MDESGWHKFIGSGLPKELPIGRLAPELCRILQSPTDRVVIRHDYALKIVHKHALDFYHFPMLAITLDLGMAIHDLKRPRHMTFLHYEAVVFSRWFKLVVKATGRDELYAATFHKVDAEDIKRLKKGRHIIRAPKE
jgi:hypothetical protein